MALVQNLLRQFGSNLTLKMTFRPAVRTMTSYWSSDPWTSSGTTPSEAAVFV